MNSDNALAINQNRELMPAIWTMIRDMAPVMHQARLFGVASPEQAAAIMLKGYELGLPITASFEFINVIDGKPSLSPRGALALLNSKGVLDEYKLTILTDKNGAYFGHECYMKRGKVEHTARFTLDDAKRAQLTEGSPTSNGKRGYGNWEKYPQNMAMWRAIGYCADVVAPDITGGLTTFLKAAEQFDATVDETGNFVDAKFAPAPTPVASTPAPLPASAPTPPPPTEGITLGELATLYSPEMILAANGGKFPGTQEEINIAALKLAGGA